MCSRLGAQMLKVHFKSKKLRSRIGKAGGYESEVDGSIPADSQTFFLF